MLSNSLTDTPNSFFADVSYNSFKALAGIYKNGSKAGKENKNIF